MNPLIIYHTNESTPCADGFGAAFAAWMHFGNDAEYLPMKYGDDIPNYIEIQDREVYILDFSFHKETMLDLFRYCKKVIWLDHHAGVFKDWGFEPNTDPKDYIDEAGLRIEGKYAGKNHKVILDNTRSGALIAWMYFKSNMFTPVLIRHIDDYDRWQFKLDSTKEFITALYARTLWSFEQWHDIMMTDAHFEMYTEGKVLLRAQAMQVKSIVNSISAPCFFRIHDVDGDFMYEGLAANCPPFLTNEVGHALANKSETFGMCWYQKSNGMIKVSLRSNGFNVLKLAKEYKGGGHKTAAGFEITNGMLFELLCPF